ncbi:ribonuclease III, partial [Patescibacteria group bacterium]|nr:ribonuclease III [Patescibacteria group bacterium]
GITPNYELIKEDGPDHDKEFQVGVYLEDELIAKGQGPSKQAAQEDAAKKALDKKSWN